MVRAKEAATAAAFAVLVGVVGAAAFVAARDEPNPPPPTTTTTTTPTADDLALAIATALSDGLDVPLDDTEARCVADGVLAQLGPARLEALTSAGPVTPSAKEQAALVRTVVGCVPPDKAAALLGTFPSTTLVAELPDEG